MKYKDLPAWSRMAADWGENYFATIRRRPVRSSAKPGEFLSKLPAAAPEKPDDMHTIFEDFERMVPDGMTHWQHPRFFAYFSANAAPASILAEQLANYIAANCMLWQTSPAATELETRMVDWFRDSLGLPGHFRGVIHDSATVANLCAVLTMREKALNWDGVANGISGQRQPRIYATSENHSSIDKAARIAGIGSANLVRVSTDDERSMRPESLRHAIEADLAAGLVPAGVVLCVGGTSTGAVDGIAPVAAVAENFGLNIHVDAAWAGAAMICDEFRRHWEGIEQVDSIVINPHKWIGAQFDCSVQFLANPDSQIRTVGLRPDYLSTSSVGQITNFNEWTIPLGRRFRALKLWFVFRAYGVEGLREMIRNHVSWVRELQSRFDSDPEFEVLTTCPFGLFTFRLSGSDDSADEKTRQLLERVNNGGQIYLTQTTIGGRFAIRMTAGQFECTKADVEAVYPVVKEAAENLRAQ
ncbi:MAG: pyridoxal-dependent decarboxylase [Albidovulum sp.]|nr:pyridoxal-dependent decarboxylase [Albidovulum sp.]